MSEVLAERERAVALFEIYQKKLTLSQQELFSDYYLYDLSLSEIAENRSISRSAISDSLQKSLQKMEEWEQNLSLLKRKETILHSLAQLEKETDSKKKEALIKAIEEACHGI